MANPRRIKRLQQLILETVATHLLRELDDPRIGIVSVTRVKLSPDLSTCQVFWTSLGTESELRTTERGLQDALASIQRAVARAMQTRVTPRMEMRHDGTFANAQRLESIFTKLREERGEIAALSDEPTAAEEPDDGSESDGS
ncbi:MAG: 30S ribosome-binding factor RbfA [Planctomycetota bacterium]|nr:30S ribosome-binding factor RbfA [Planctomycetota bacterium]